MIFAATITKRTELCFSKKYQQITFKRLDTLKEFTIFSNYAIFAS